MSEGLRQMFEYGTTTPPHCRDREETGVIRPTAHVTIVGLHGRSDLNGENAVVGQYCEEKGRWECHLTESGKSVRVKSGNLRVKARQPTGVMSAQDFLQKITPPGTTFSPKKPPFSFERQQNGEICGVKKLDEAAEARQATAEIEQCMAYARENQSFNAPAKKRSTKQNKSNLSPSLELHDRADAGRTTLRFGLGDRVECLHDTDHASNGDSWLSGTIMALFYHEEKFGPDMCVPYQIWMDSGNRIFAPRDDPKIIRATAKLPPKPSFTAEPFGAIPPNASANQKAIQLVDLLLAPSGDAVLMGLPAMVGMQLQRACGFDSSPLGHLTADEMEVNAALFLLGKIADEGDEERQIVRGAMAMRPESLDALLKYIAYTPPIGDEDTIQRAYPEYPHGWDYCGDFKGRSSRDTGGCVVYEGRGEERTLGLSPRQASAAYCIVMACMLRLLAWLGSSAQDEDDASVPGDEAFTRRLCAAPALPACIEKLTEIASRWGEAGLDELPARALDALTCLCASQPRPRWLLRALEPADSNLVGAYDASNPVSKMDSLIADLFGVSNRPRANIGALTPIDKQNLSVLLAVYAGGQGKLSFEHLARKLPADVEVSFDALINGSGSGGAEYADALTDELARCLTHAERMVAMAFFLSAVLLPIGRVVRLDGLASRAALNGQLGVVSGSRREGQELRYPVRPLPPYHTTDSESQPIAAPLECLSGDVMAVRPRNLVLLRAQDQRLAMGRQ